MGNLAELLDRLLEGWTIQGDNLTLSLLSGRFTTPPFHLTHEKSGGLWDIRLFYRSKEIGRGLAADYSVSLVKAAVVAEGVGFRLGSSECIEINGSSL